MSVQKMLRLEKQNGGGGGGGGGGGEQTILPLYWIVLVW